jgi:hypothetical protein
MRITLGGQQAVLNQRCLPRAGSMLDDGTVSARSWRTNA